MAQIIPIHVQAPAKPAFGAPCNGCGVCCLSEPCPIGIVLSGRRRGACRMLRWDEGDSRYRCGALGSHRGVFTLWNRLARRWISAGSGCDCSLEVQALAPDPAQGQAQRR